MRKEFQPRAIVVTLLTGLLSLPCGLMAQNANKPVWCMKTDKGQYVEMSRVQKLDGVDEKETFKVIVYKGQGATGVQSVTFEKHEIDPTIVPVVVKGDADGNGYVDKNDILEIADHILEHKSDKFNFDGADVNEDKKVDAADLVAVVSIVKANKAGIRGMFKPFNEQLSVSDDVPGRIDSQDDSGEAYPEYVPGTIYPQNEVWPLEPLPGTVNWPYNRPVPETPEKEIIPELITIEPEPERIIAEEPVPDLGSVPYFRVQFSENLLEVKKYAADGYTFFNPARDFLDFKYYLPFTDSNLSGEPASEYYYYIGTGPDPKVRTRFAIAKTDGSLAIKKITAYNQPVQFITVSTDGLSEENAGKRTITYIFNALPRNIEELKTLEVNNREYFNSPHFVTALFICCLNRITENSSDAWNMLNYLRIHTATIGENNILKVSNVAMQDIVQHLLDNDINGYPVSNGLRSYFAGSSPDNHYTPTEPYQVTLVEQSDAYTTEDGFRCAKLYVKSSGDDNLVGPLKLRKVDDHGWLVYSGEEGFTKKMKTQK